MSRRKKPSDTDDTGGSPTRSGEPSDFASALDGVRPIGGRDKRVRAKSPRVASPGRRNRERLVDAFEHPDPTEPRLAHRTSLKAATFERLERGALTVDRSIDLHGMRADAARDALRRALTACARAGDSVLRVVHGRGKHSGGFAVLRDALPEWLEAESRVLAFAPARSTDKDAKGDPAGATCVLLRTR